MKTPNYNTLAFIRYYFHIPESCRLSWGLIEETLDGKTEIRLGVALLNRPNFYIDVAMRRFFTETELFGGGLVRKVHVARRKAAKDAFVFSGHARPAVLRRAPAPCRPSFAFFGLQAYGFLAGVERIPDERRAAGSDGDEEIRVMHIAGTSVDDELHRQGVRRDRLYDDARKV